VISKTPIGTDTVLARSVTDEDATATDRP